MDQNRTDNRKGLNREERRADVCVVGGGMAGLCAAIAAARNGASTVLLHDRPMFGGNASSEIRMWICGAHGKDNKETGILEEIQLENLYRNPGRNYPMWDHVLWEKARFQPGLSFELNCSVTDARCEDDRIAAVTAWQSTTQTWHTVEADLFVDCSGDSILAAVTPAECRWGRESQAEFGEDIEPLEADGRTMGHTILIQTHRGDKRRSFTPPKWAYRFESPEEFAFRLKGVRPHNFWWLELGGIRNTIRDTEAIRDELLRTAYGVWDYIKNRAPEREEAACWSIHWIGMLPGKRESRRYVGDHVLTQRDIEAGGAFPDTVAFGGWSMDDHHPAGLLYPGAPTVHHPAPSPYGIPYRCLYSRNLDNLLFAGRNVSVTHAALSSTRVMGTCAVIGQAAGTAAALCARHGVSPRSLGRDRIASLQETLLHDDCFLPGLRRNVDPLTAAADLRGPGSGLERSRDGVERDRGEEKHHWEGPTGAGPELHWDRTVEIGGVRLVLDSDLNNDKRMPCHYPVNSRRTALPSSLLRAFRVEIRSGKEGWTTVHRETENRQRLVLLPLGVRAGSIRIVPEETWGRRGDGARIFAFEALARLSPKIPVVPEGPGFAEIRAAQDPVELAPPAKPEGPTEAPGETA